MQDLLKSAISLHQKGNLDEAEKIYQQLLSQDANQADVLHLLGILSAQKEQFNLALNYLHSAIKLQPDSATFHNSLGNIYKNLNNLEAAITHYQQALRIEPNSPTAQNNLGTLFYKRAQFDLAISHYLAAIMAKPDYADAYFNLSNIYFLQKNFSKAAEYLEKALAYQPSHLQAHYLLGKTYAELGNYEQAISHYQERLTSDPNHAETHHNLAVALTKLNQINLAISHYEKAIELNENYAEALHNVGALYILTAKLNDALKCYLKLLTIQPDLDTYYNLGVIYMYQDRHADAIAYLLQALKLDANYINAHINLGGIYLKIEDPANAIKHYQIALQLQPDNHEIHYLLSALTQQDLPKAAPKEYIEHLFDQYANAFDTHLQEHLNYRVPELLYNAVINKIDGKHKAWTILDLGCGTGLTGEKFRLLANKLFGVDLSSKMLEIARQKNIYDELKLADINDALSHYHNIDLIIAADVFGYIGDLELIFQKVNAALINRGIFAFTVEKANVSTYQLQANARFAHSKDYIIHLAEDAGFKLINFDNAILRLQKKIPVEGYLFILQKVAAITHN